MILREIQMNQMKILKIVFQIIVLDTEDVNPPKAIVPNLIRYFTLKKQMLV